MHEPPTPGQPLPDSSPSPRAGGRGEMSFQLPGQVLMHRGTTALCRGREMTMMILGPKWALLSLGLGRQGRIGAQRQGSPAPAPRKGLQGKRQRRERPALALGNADHSEGVSSPYWYHPRHLTHNPHPNPGLTPLQTWPLPAPQCDPGSYWQLRGARGTDGVHVQERWGAQG